ncbi:MAG: alanine racemase [Acidimicrobiia bacterium]|nr:MAG: alanine racemase [Acidimicrobiia bacterium]
MPTTQWHVVRRPNRGVVGDLRPRRWKELQAVTSIIGSPWQELDTPRLVVDAERLDRNISDFHGYVLSHGVAFRPHLKTHKTLEIARKQIGSGAIGAAVAKVSEAEVFVDGGMTNLVIAYPVFGERKWSRIAQLSARCDKLVVHVENEQAIRGLSEAAAKVQTSVGVRIEIDSGFHRTGVDADGAISLASLIEVSESLYLDGVTTHRGALFPDGIGKDPWDLGVAEGELIVGVAETLRAAGFKVPNVIAGSTPTGKPAATVDGVTEVCIGTYVFNDVGQQALGIVGEDALALSVVATVVVAHEGGAQYTIDAGSKILTSDGYPGGDPMFGTVVGRDDVVVRLTEEHGMVAAAGPLPAVGDVVRVYPMHVCPVVNLAEELVVISGDRVVDVWSVAARGCSR